jgi:ethanolamine utilization protein EutP (predicted NTPase)
MLTQTPTLNSNLSMRSIKDQLVTIVTFEGIDTKAILEGHPRMYEAVWKSASQFPDANIRISVAHALDNQAEWVMTVANAAGRKTIAFVQHGEGSVHQSVASI